MNNAAYTLISDYYGHKTTNRTGVRLMNHIDEGLKILDHLNASDNAKDAYCIHPMVQSNLDLACCATTVFDSIQPYVILLAMEYRSVANAHLSDNPSTIIHLSVLRDVDMMLIADKVQNKKDFEAYHKGTHEHSDRLTAYFDRWLAALDVSPSQELELLRLL